MIPAQQNQWDAFISYTQRNGEYKNLANILYHGLREYNGQKMTVWFDTMMQRCDKESMREGIQKSACVIALISGSAKKENRYFERENCVNELRWAIEFGKPVVPVIYIADKPQVGRLIREGQ